MRVYRRLLVYFLNNFMIIFLSLGIISQFFLAELLIVSLIHEIIVFAADSCHAE